MALVSLVFVVVGSVYCFILGPAVRHVPGFWASPSDLGLTFRSASNLARGHFSTVYGRSGLVSFPGILLLLLPFGALSNVFRSTVVEISSGGHPLAQTQSTVVHQYLANPAIGHGGGNVYVAQPQWLLFVFPFTLILGCSALFACDALARHLGVRLGRRRLLTVAEASLLWSPIVVTGHPEDVVAIAFAVYALVFALKGRMAPAGWLFGVAVAFQPLVLLMAPILLVMAGWPDSLSFGVRSIVPSAALLALPLATGFSATLHTLLYQPNYPLVDHQTPWTVLAPRISGRGNNLAVASGPGRVLAVFVAGALGYRARKWRADPDQLLWACAFALALRCYTESVMDPYYAWPALALGLVAASRRSPARFGVAIGLAASTTAFSLEGNIAWLPWWLVTTGGMTAVLALAAPRLRIPTGELSRVTTEAPVSTRAPVLARVGATASSASAGPDTEPAPATRTPRSAGPGSRSGTTAFKKKGASPQARRKPSARR